MRKTNCDPTTNVSLTEGCPSLTLASTVISNESQVNTTLTTPEVTDARTSTESTDSSQPETFTSFADSNWLTYIFRRYRALPRYSRIVFTLSLITDVTQIIAIISVLSITGSQTCESLFRFYLIACAVSLLLNIPLMGVYYLHPEGHNTHCPTTVFLSWVCRSRSILKFCRTMLFFMGNYVVFTSLTCTSGSPGLYGLTVALLAFGYLRAIIPAILCAVVICLPCLIVVLRALNLAEVLETGANVESIAKLNIVRYRKSKSEQANHTATLDKDSTEVLHVMESSKIKTRPNPFTRILLKMFRRNKSKEKHQNMDLEKGNEEDNLKVVHLSDEDAVCCICLEEYVDGEKLREMRCAHYFHVPCIDEWLQLNRTCPLCKRDIEFTDS